MRAGTVCTLLLCLTGCSVEEYQSKADEFKDAFTEKLHLGNTWDFGTGGISDDIVNPDSNNTASYWLSPFDTYDVDDSKKNDDNVAYWKSKFQKSGVDEISNNDNALTDFLEGTDDVIYISTYHTESKRSNISKQLQTWVATSDSAASVLNKELFNSHVGESSVNDNMIKKDANQKVPKRKTSDGSFVKDRNSNYVMVNGYYRYNLSFFTENNQGTTESLNAYLNELYLDLKTDTVNTFSTSLENSKLPLSYVRSVVDNYITGAPVETLDSKYYSRLLTTNVDVAHNKLYTSKIRPANIEPYTENSCAIGRHLISTGYAYDSEGYNKEKDLADNLSIYLNQLGIKNVQTDSTATTGETFADKMKDASDANARFHIVFVSGGLPLPQDPIAGGVELVYTDNSYYQVLEKGVAEYFDMALLEGNRTDALFCFMSDEYVNGVGNQKSSIDPDYDGAVSVEDLFGNSTTMYMTNYAKTPTLFVMYDVYSSGQIEEDTTTQTGSQSTGSATLTTTGTDIAYDSLDADLKLLLETILDDTQLTDLKAYDASANCTSKWKISDVRDTSTSTPAGTECIFYNPDLGDDEYQFCFYTHKETVNGDAIFVIDDYTTTSGTTVRANSSQKVLFKNGKPLTGVNKTVGNITAPLVYFTDIEKIPSTTSSGTIKADLQYLIDGTGTPNQNITTNLNVKGKCVMSFREDSMHTSKLDFTKIFFYDVTEVPDKTGTGAYFADDMKYLGFYDCSTGKFTVPTSSSGSGSANPSTPNSTTQTNSSSTPNSTQDSTQMVDSTLTGQIQVKGTSLTTVEIAQFLAKALSTLQ